MASNRWYAALPMSFLACAASSSPGGGGGVAQAAPTPTVSAGASSVKEEWREDRLTEGELARRKKALPPDVFHVTQEQGTEPPFHNAFWNNHAPGIYVDVVSGEPLFASTEKFESGTGWPSFWAPLEAPTADGGKKTYVEEQKDTSLGMERDEVHSKIARSHLGHVFDDGPRPTGKRYCIDSASLRFIPAERLALEGYGRYAAKFPDVKQLAAPSSGAVSVPFPPAAAEAAAQNRQGVAAGLEVAVMGGGCFWGMEELLRKLDGVVATEVGYAGGDGKTAEYEVVSSGATGHAESVRVVFDPKRVSYEEVVKYFFKIHDPTTLNRQHNDVGTQYRSVLFYQSPEQGRVAEEVKARAEKSGKFDGHIVTQIVPAMRFYKAEDYHQKYLVKHPDGYNCHFLRKIDI